MKTILKLIFIGVIAGMVWKYLDERNIDLTGRAPELARMIVNEISRIQAAAAEEDVPCEEGFNDEERSVEFRNPVQQDFSDEVSTHSITSYSTMAGSAKSNRPVTLTSGAPGENSDWIMEATRQYSPESWFMLMEYDALPMQASARLSNGGINRSSKPAGTFSFLEGDSKTEMLASMSTNVHEIGHGYFQYNVYRHAAETNIELDWDHVDGYIYISPSETYFITFPKKYLFPSRELMNVIPSSLTFRYDTYIFGNTSTQQDGVIGLLDELNAYFLGSRFSYDMLESYKIAADSDVSGLLDWMSNSGSVMTAYYEFDYFILEYLLYMKNNYPLSYAELKACTSFRTAYSDVRRHYRELLKDYTEKINSEIRKINSSGNFEAQVEGDRFRITDVPNGSSRETTYFHEDREKLLTVLGSSRYREVEFDFQ